MKISARNVLAGTVKRVEPGAINDEVVIALEHGIEIVAIITHASAQRLGLAPGKPAHAVIKASDVMVAVDP